MDPLFHLVDNITKRVKEGNPRSQHKIKTIDKPRAVGVHNTSVLNIWQISPESTCYQFRQGDLAFNKGQILFVLLIMAARASSPPILPNK